MKSSRSKARLCSPGRPPHGGRGLKYDYIYGKAEIRLSPPARGAWIEIL